MSNVFRMGLFCFVLITHISICQITVLEGSMHHLRNGVEQEWAEFPVDAREKKLVVHFDGAKNRVARTLSLRQYEVKQHWKILLNGKQVGSLQEDEKDMVVYYNISPGSIVDGQNELLIECDASSSDDIKVGDLRLYDTPLVQLLSQSSLEIDVRAQETNDLIPARLTILNSDGILQSVISPEATLLAIRPGFVYSANGKALITMPGGHYRIYAGRGFEYNIDSVTVDIRPGERIRRSFHLKREVNTDGWVSCDTHIHTVTHSSHGDATIEERAITIAGEGIELPVLTDHNINVDITQAAREKHVLSYFTPLVGNELTTKVGHFNLFQTMAGVPVIDHEVENWNDVAVRVDSASSIQAVVLNHARDIHHGFRPFGSERHLSNAGTSNEDWRFPANAMEVINSGSQQTDMMQLFYDWFGMLNRGHFLTPVGSSDSHDVSRFIVGQGRTYIKVDDRDAGKINVDAAIKSFRDGKVMVSLGLMTKILVNNYGPGDLAPGTNSATVTVEVAGPSWTKVNCVSLYANGNKIKEEKIPDGSNGGSKWKRSWNISIPEHDVYFVAIAEGPGDGMAFWPIAKPYQPASISWTPKLVGSSGAVWIDGDKNGKRNAAHDYAQQILRSSNGDIKKIIKRLSGFDEAVAVQAAALLWKQGINLTSAEIAAALNVAAESTQRGFATVIREISLLEKEKR